MAAHSLREEKEFGFRGAEGRLLLLQDCEVRVHLLERGKVRGGVGADAEVGRQSESGAGVPSLGGASMVSGALRGEWRSALW